MDTIWFVTGDQGAKEDHSETRIKPTTGGITHGFGYLFSFDYLIIFGNNVIGFGPKLKENGYRVKPEDLRYGLGQWTNIIKRIVY